MISRSTVVQLVAFALISVIGVTYVSARHLGIGDLLSGRSYVVSVDLGASADVSSLAERLLSAEEGGTPKGKTRETLGAAR